ncbi:hypothetical protein [Variovorax sp.]|jgi:hypothetical protein|uniref:hypothetical protein n=1 Tax=Variovorax sp. TaxID=1871043 RepID=UPI001220C6C0|nr:hypothetical protein [Variovorax sp.]TAJ61520.1 MAG: hypothetical protein EPO53_21325 [Variovorax sp.]
MPMPDRAQAPARPDLLHDRTTTSRRPRRWRLLAGTALLATMAALSGCGGGGGGSSFGFAGFPPPSGPGTGNPPPSDPPMLASIDSQLPADTATTAQRCDFLDPAHCMLPFPNDYYTVADASTDTGRRLNLQTASMPRSEVVRNKPIDTTEWNRNDGFSPGAMIVTRVPGVDLVRTGAPGIGDLSASLKADAPVVLIDADTLEQKLIWVELDKNNVSAPDRQSLNIRVAKNLEWGHRYIVAMRNMKDAAGKTIEAGPAFRIYRDRHESALGFVNDRRAHMESILSTLQRAGMAREPLYLAWDFTVGSQRSITGRMLAIRDAGFAALTDGTPGFKVTTVQDLTPAQDARIARHIEGTLTVPSFVAAPTAGTADITPVIAAVAPYLGGGALSVPAVKAAFDTLGDKPLPLETFRYASATPGVYDTPVWDGHSTLTVPFICNIPRAALNPDGSINPARISLYGHGLFGKPTEVNASNVKDMSNEHNFVFCATNWYGFSQTEIVPSVFGFFDLSNARVPFDTTQQGVLNMLMLGRAMQSAKGFGSNAAFQMGTTPRSVLDTSELFYDGNSQGGILGGMLMSVAQDIHRGVLGVPGMNYSLLLERSADFPEFATMVYAAYPDSLDQQFIFSLWQTLWDRAEANGYAQAMTDKPLPGTPAHKVLMHVAFGDHQVTMWSAEVEARTIGAKLYCPATASGRHPDAVPYFQLSCMDLGAGGYDGSAMVVWDSGPGRLPPPPQDNLAPTAGSDPHEDPRATPAARQQKSEFLRSTGKVVDVCGGAPCRSAAYAP